VSGAFVDELRRRLAEIERQDLGRSLRQPAGRDFCSNDYLGLARDAVLRRSLLDRLAALPADEPLGAPASRLLRGHTALHERVERRLAAFKGTEAALLFPSGYQANLGLLTAIAGPADRVISDAQNHASLIDALRLARCRTVVVPHLDLAAVERELARTSPAAPSEREPARTSPAVASGREPARTSLAAASGREPLRPSSSAPAAEGRTFVVVESLFSMDGDVAPLDRYAELAARHGAELVVDDAHATGLFGAARGSGLCELFGVERRAAAIVSTLGKALGLAGAFVAGPRALIDYLINRCRPFIYTTAVPPLLLHAAEATLDRLQAEPERRARVLALAGRLRQQLRRRGVDCPPGAGPIVPVILGGNRRALAAAERLAAAGFDVRAIRPPSVAPGSARLRISVHADHTEAEIDELAQATALAVRGAGEAEAAPEAAAPGGAFAAIEAPAGEVVLHGPAPGARAPAGE
jgi:8-amino-7-oxononanoate synthase